MITFTCLATITTIFATPGLTSGYTPAHFDVTAQPIVAQVESVEERLPVCELIRDAQIDAIKASYVPGEIQWIGGTFAVKNGVTGVID